MSETPNPLDVLREYLPPPTHDPPCEHGCCRIPAALAQVADLVPALIGLGWDIGLGQLCFCDDRRWDRDPETGHYGRNPDEPDDHSDQCKQARAALVPFAARENTTEET